MYDHNDGKDLRDKPNRSSHPWKTEERRGANRHSITAAAEIIEVASGARFTTRTSDLGPGGCFVDSLTPFPIGSRVRVTVRQSDSEFEVGGAVVYSQVGLGMGIAFDELTYEQRLDLEAWLAEVATGKSTSLQKQTAPKTEPKSGDMHRAALAGLIKLLVSKRILTDSEAASLLQDPIL